MTVTSRPVPARKLWQPWEKRRPLARHQLFHTEDVATAEAIGGRVFSPHRLRPERASAIDATMHCADLGALRLVYLAYGAPVTVETATPLDYYAVNVALGGRAKVHFGSTELTLDHSRATVFSPAEHVGMSWSRDLAQLCVKIDRTALVNHAGRITAHSLRGELRFEPFLPPAAVWLPTMRMIDDVLARCDSAAVPAALATQLEQSVMTMLLLQQPNSYSAKLLAESPAASKTAVREIAELIQDSPEQHFTVAGLAERAGVSVRALQEGFRREFGTTPSAFLANARLDRARALIEHASVQPLRVSDVAYQVGFAHLGRFASAYRNRFGLTPSEDIRRR